MEQAYDDAKYGQFSRRPYMDMVIPSLTDPSVAPPGKHVMSCFVQYAPYHLKDGGLGRPQREAFGDAVINAIAEYAPNIKNIILHRQVLTPLDIERDFGLTEGNIFQGELTLEQLFFLRPVPGWAQYATPIDRLYMCGSATHPGGGIMGAPGKNAAERILKDVAMTSTSRSALRRDRHRRRRQRADLRARAREGRRAHAAARAARRAGRLRGRRRDRARLHARRCSRTPPGRSAATSSKSCSCTCTGSRSAIRRSSVSTLSPDGRPLVIYEDARKTAEGLRAWSAKDAARWPAFQVTLRRLGALIGSLFIDHAAVGGRAVGARRVRADAHAAAFPRAAEGRSVAAAAMGTDGGRRSRQRVVRDRAAARGGRGRRHLRRDARPVVGRQRIAAAAACGQSMRSAWPAGHAGHAADRSRSRARSKPRPRDSASRSGPAAAVARIDVEGRSRASASTLDGGEHIEARAVVSGVDPKRTFLSCATPITCRRSSCGA